MQSTPETGRSQQHQRAADLYVLEAEHDHVGKAVMHEHQSSGLRTAMNLVGWGHGRYHPLKLFNYGSCEDVRVRWACGSACCGQRHKKKTRMGDWMDSEGGRQEGG